MLKDWSCCLLIESCFCDIVTQTQSAQQPRSLYFSLKTTAAPNHCQLWLHGTSVFHMPSACKHRLLAHPGERIGSMTAPAHFSAIGACCLCKHCFTLVRCYEKHKYDSPIFVLAVAQIVALAGLVQARL